MLVAQGINFLLLLVILKKFLYTPLVNLMSDRRKKIEQGLKDAEAAAAKLESGDREAKEKISAAITRANEIRETAKKDAKKQADEIVSEAKTKAVTIVDASKERAKQQEDQITQKAKNRVAEIVGIALEKIVAEKPSEKDISRAISEVK